MHDAEKIEDILFHSINEYLSKNIRLISKVERGYLSNQFERSNGLTITLDNGKIVEILIFELKS